MRHVRMLGLCLVAALALGAYAVSSASALEWGKCEYVGPNAGKYGGAGAHEGTGQNCAKSEKAHPKLTGEYEWRKASEVAEKRVAEGKSANVPFSGGSVEGGGVLTTTGRACEGGAGYGYPYLFRVTRKTCEEMPNTTELVYEENTLVECSSETNTGEAEGKNKVANIKVVFKGCVIYGSYTCTGEGKEEGEIETNTLKGKLGWLNKANKEVGVVLEPAQHHGLFASFECISGAVQIGVGVGNKKEGTEFTSSGCYGLCPGATPEEEKHGGYDQIISPITPVNTMTSEFEQVFSQEAEYPYRNIPTNFEGKHLSALESYENNETDGSTMWSSAGEVVRNVNTPEEAGEIKA